MKFRIYFNWFLVNAVFCLLPIIIAALISQGINESIFLSILSYSFTLTIASLYIYDRYAEPESSFKILVYIFSFILIICYIFYPQLLDPEYLEYIDKNSITILIVCLFLTLISSFIMNFRDMNKIADRLDKKKKFKDKLSKGDELDAWVAKQNRDNG